MLSSLMNLTLWATINTSKRIRMLDADQEMRAEKEVLALLVAQAPPPHPRNALCSPFAVSHGNPESPPSNRKHRASSSKLAPLLELFSLEKWSGWDLERFPEQY